MTASKTDGTEEQKASSFNIEHSRSEEFEIRYANNVYLESSGWDLRLIFGELDQSLGPNKVVQHTAINVPWPQIKSLVYLLQVHLMTYEAIQGKVSVARGTIKPLPSHAPKEYLANGGTAESYAALRKLYEAFAAENPQAIIAMPNKQ